MIHLGVKYVVSDYLLLGWQENDLPSFSQILHIFVFNDCALFRVDVYSAYGFDHHYHSYPLRKNGIKAIHWLSELPDFQTFRGHFVNDCLYVTFRSHVENVSE